MGRRAMLECDRASAPGGTPAALLAGRRADGWATSSQPLRSQPAHHSNRSVERAQPRERALSDATPSPSVPTAPGAVARAGRYAGYVFWLMFLINFINYF